jgi:filamentous hemagglutinin family protein
MTTQKTRNTVSQVRYCQVRYCWSALSAALLAAGLCSPVLHAAPSGSVVRAGEARVEQHGTLTRIDQTSARAIIDWRGFDVGAAEQVRFNQPSPQAATLNRVTGEQQSRIDGHISANGQVFLVNQHGVIFGNGAKIDVGSLFVSTANIGNPDFMAGRLNFNQRGQPGAQIRNEGVISAAEGGLVALVAPHVRNDGVIVARLGKVTLASGDRYTLDLFGDQLIQLQIPETEADALLVAQAGRIEHLGRIEADGGRVVLVNAASGKQALDGVINLAGVIQADTVRQQSGRIVLESSGAVNLSGELHARGMQAGESGGSIDVRGQSIELVGARLDAQGDAGGGVVHVGGTWQGGTGPRAQTLAVDYASRIQADAISQGQGGEVVFWSDGETRFAGLTTARGGAQSGDGGRVEVSGLGQLEFQGLVDAGASVGKAGQLLLDPKDLLIGAPEAAVIARVLRTGTTTTLQASQDIEVNSLIDGRGGRDGGGLDFSAGQDIRINDFIVTQNGAVRLDAIAGTFSMAPGKAIFAGNAEIDIAAGGDLSLGSLLTSNILSLASRSGGVRIGAPVEAGNGDLIVRAAGDIDIAAAIVNLRAGSDVALEAGGSIHVAAPIDGTGGVDGGSVRLVAGGGIDVGTQAPAHVATQNGAITLDAAGAINFSPDAGLYAGSGAITLTGSQVTAGILSGNGGIAVQSRSGDLMLGGVMQTGGAVQLTSPTSLTVAQPIGVTGNGSLSINAGLDLSVDALLLASESASLTLTAGRDLRLNAALVSDQGDMALSADGSVISSAQAGLYSTSGAVRVDAVQTLNAPTVMTVGLIDLTSQSGSLRLLGQIRGGSAPVEMTAAGDIAVDQSIVLGNGGSLNLAAGRALSVNAIVEGGSGVDFNLSAGGDVTLNRDLVAQSGSIDVTAAGAMHFAADSGVYAGSGSIRLDAGSGNMTPGYLQAGSGAALDSGGSLTIARAIGGDVGSLTLTADGYLAINAQIANLSQGLSANAGSNLFVNSPLNGIGNVLVLSAGNDVHVNADVASANAPLSVNAGGTLVQAANGVDAYGAPLTRQLRSGGAPLSVQVGGDLNLGSLVTSGSLSVVSTGGDININVPIYETTGYTRLSAAADILVNQVIANATTGADLLMQAGGDIAVNAKIGPWDRSDATYPTDNRDALPGGKVQLLAGGDILIDREIGTYRGGLTGADDAAIDLTSTGGSVLLTPGIKVSSDGGAISVSAHADLENGPEITVLDLVHLNAIPDTGYFTTGALSLTSTGGDVNIEQWIPRTTGSVTIRAADRLEINQRIYTNHGDISLYAGAGGIWQNPLGDPEPNPLLSTASVSDIDSGNGNLYLQAIGDIQPHILRSGGNLTVKSTAGAIVGGRIDISRETPSIPLGMPDQVELAGYSGISGFSAQNSPHVAAISANGSIVNLGVFYPNSLLMIAAQHINTPTFTLGQSARLYAGRDIVLNGLNGGDITAYAGRDLVTTLNIAPGIVGSLDLSAGYAPFDTLAGITVAGVAAPVWGGPSGAGSISISTAVPGTPLWVEGEGGFVARATGDVTLPQVHVSYALNPSSIPHWANTLGQQRIQPFNISAGGNITLTRLQTVGPVSMVSTGSDIQIDFTLGAHVSTDPLVDPAAVYWNPADLGLASLILRADIGDISMHEARAEGDISITALNGGITFMGGFNGVEAGGTRVVSNAGDDVLFSNTIDSTPVTRIPRPALAGPAVAVGPTLAGPGAAPQPGALPPTAPAAPLIAGSSPGAAPGAPNAAGGSVANSGPSGVSVDSSQAGNATGGDSFGEIFVADNAAEQPVERRRETTEESETAQQEATTEKLAEATPEAMPEATPETSKESAESPFPTMLDEEEKRKEKAIAAPLPAETYLVFAGGRGDAKEQDFGRSEPVEYNRVRP